MAPLRGCSAFGGIFLSWAVGCVISRVLQGIGAFRCSGMFRFVRFCSATFGLDPRSWHVFGTCSGWSGGDWERSAESACCAEASREWAAALGSCSAFREIILLWAVGCVICCVLQGIGAFRCSGMFRFVRFCSAMFGLDPRSWHGFGMGSGRSGTDWERSAESACCAEASREWAAALGSCSAFRENILLWAAGCVILLCFAGNRGVQVFRKCSGLFGFVRRRLVWICVVGTCSGWVRDGRVRIGREVRSLRAAPRRAGSGLSLRLSIRLRRSWDDVNEYTFFDMSCGWQRRRPPRPVASPPQIEERGERVK